MPLPTLRQDLIGFFGLVIIAICLGFGVNAWRAEPLPLRYQPPAERMVRGVRGEGRGHVDGGLWMVSGGAKSWSEGSGGAWSVNLEASGAADISLAELKALIGKPVTLILDTRPSLFYEVGHIPGALNLSRKEFQADFKRLSARLSEASGDTPHAARKRIVVYCAGGSCEDSQIVAEALTRLGYGPIRIFKGGWEGWVAAGGEAEASDQ